MSADTLPLPPAGLSGVVPAPELAAWVWGELVSSDGPLHNPDHAHLEEWEAHVGFLWAGEPLTKSGRRVLGRCRLGRPTGDAWAQAEKREQLAGWFGAVPDFVVTIDAHHHAHTVRTGRPAAALATLDHELYHCGIDRDRWGAQRFLKDGSPVWGIRGHDVEEFVGVVRRYGSDAAGVTALVDAARQRPEVGPADLDGVCGCGAAIGGAR